MTPQSFIATIKDAARQSMEVTRVYASFVIAEGALESGWGNSGLVAKAMNLFGVKADASWHGPVVEMPTEEFIGGKSVTVMAKWRKYSSWYACINDHAQFLLKNPRYKSAFNCSNVFDFVEAIAKAGYATDENYSQKIHNIIEQYDLAQYDNVVSISQVAPSVAPVAPVVETPPKPIAIINTPVKPVPPTPVQPQTPPVKTGWSLWRWIASLFENPASNKH